MPMIYNKDFFFFLKRHRGRLLLEQVVGAEFYIFMRRVDLCPLVP